MKIKFKHIISSPNTSISANQQISIFTLTLIGILMLSSCAQIMAPGGGKKDELPPKVVKFSPDSAQLNFNSKTIEIDFDEFVTLKDLNSQLIISPPLLKSPDVTVKNKTLKVEFDKNELLKPNTTYCINFGNAVQDLNEGNSVDNFSYIFSTGNFIDSLKLKGKVRNGFNQSTEKGILVMLYSDLSDSVVYKGQPDYFGKTQGDGSFQINNIRSGNYKLVAIKDANANYKYDGESEWIGFFDTLIDANSKTLPLIELFQEPAKKVYLKKYIHDSYGKVSLFFNQGSDSLRVQPLNNTDKGVQEYLEFSKAKDTLTYWINNFQKDSLILQVNNGNKVVDTVSIQVIKRAEAEKSKKHPLKLSLVNSPNGNQSFDLGTEFVLKFNNRLAGSDPTKFTIKEDSTLMGGKKGDFHFSNWDSRSILSVWDTTNTVEDPNNLGNFVSAALKSSYNEWKENTKYHVLFLPGAFTDFFGLSSDTLKVDFKTREEKYYGSVKLKLTVPPAKGQYIIQLLAENGNIVREVSYIKKSDEFEFVYLAPQKYKLKIIYDENNNFKWDTGNYLLKKQPEKVIFNSELINIRSNWDAELEWNVKD